mgnify:CR=1 FL=1
MYNKLLPQVILFSSITMAEVLYVPAEFSTIQDAIEASESGDSVLVSPGFYQENINFVKDAMYAATNEAGGTSYRSRLLDKKFMFAGKTGSSQIKKFTAEQRELEVKQKDLNYKDRDHALFVAFAPVKDPQYAISVLVEHGGSGGKAAAPIAKKVIKKVLERHELRRSINNKIGESV